MPYRTPSWPAISSLPSPTPPEICPDASVPLSGLYIGPPSRYYCTLWCDPNKGILKIITRGPGQPYW